MLGLNAGVRSLVWCAGGADVESPHTGRFQSSQNDATHNDSSRVFSSTTTCLESHEISSEALTTGLFCLISLLFSVFNPVRCRWLIFTPFSDLQAPVARRLWLRGHLFYRLTQIIWYQSCPPISSLSPQIMGRFGHGHGG